MNGKAFWSNIFWYGSIIIVMLLLRAFVFSSVIVSGDSMNPTLVDRERIISLKHAKIKRFDVITFPAPDDESKNYIKRVIGLPGDTIEYRDDVLYINGKEYKEPYLDEYKGIIDEMPEGAPLTKDFTLEEVTGEQKVPEGKYFVLGDNRQNSKDSRMIGFIDQDSVLGDVWFSFWPIAKWGTIN
ncbi:signal peptidase I [Vagococcus penaei]|uniref:Signal peptidase I n=1 Tax=Vagococcus penaei TaxID=633807 RepID=A0A1Q2D7V6_9ENTE|nr:signal peptidase I [Vagococcus penaei]AQP54432.1 signal peptidase I [Vagococcus penaei]RSU06349.1 signal peptidase I [Vagococcus penaei]